jgi:hypothetical protein
MVGLLRHIRTALPSPSHHRSSSCLTRPDPVRQACDRGGLRLGLAALVVVTAACRPELETEALAIPVGGTGQSADASLAVDPASGDVLLAWVGGGAEVWTLYVARSRDGGTTWSAPRKVAGGPQAPREVHPLGESSPRLVAAPGGRLAIAWPNSVPVAGHKWPATMLRLARSSDGGATWSPPITLNDDSATASPVSHQFHGAAWQGDSGLVVAWLDERHTKEELAAAGGAEPPGGEPDATIYAAASSDFGRQWAPNERLWGRVCPCCRVSLARGPSGAVTAAWRQHFEGSVRDVVLAPLTRGPPPTPSRVHADQWVYPGCPHTGPAVAASADGWLHTAWYSGKPGASGVFYRRVRTAPSDTGGPLVGVFRAQHVPTAHAAVAALADGGALVAYDVGPDGARVIRLARISPDGRRVAEATIPGSTGGGYPQLARTGWESAVVAYTATAGDRRSVRAVRVRLPL